MTTTTSAKVPVKMIRIERAEGLIDECYAEWFQTFEGANTELSRWAKTAPERGYNKCDFTLVYEDGTTYSGTFLLQRSHADEDNLLETHLAQITQWAREYADCPFFGKGARERLQFVERYSMGEEVAQ